MVLDRWFSEFQWYRNLFNGVTWIRYRPMKWVGPDPYTWIAEDPTVLWGRWHRGS